ncbi:MAG: DUF560 domain-containing protein [Desulfobacula sp.]|nr:DUF560 domain-containing protein [Desulfobacula sp.]
MSKENDLSKGIEFFKSGQFEQSYEILLEAIEHYPQNIELNFYLGRSAFETKNYEMAIMAFERILIISPHEHRIRLEIARAFQKLGAYNIARKYCNEVLMTNPPDTVRNNIQKFLTYMEKTEKTHFLSGRLIMGVELNNNVWASPSADKIKTIIGDVILTGPSSIKTRDWIYNTNLELNHSYQPFFSNYAWKTNVIAYNAIYNDISALDILYFGGLTGPELILDKNKFGLRFLFNQIDLGDIRYMNSVGFTTKFDHVFNSFFTTGAGLKYEKKKFEAVPQRDSNNLSLTFNMNFYFKNNWFNLGFTAENENATDNEFSYQKYIPGVSISRKLPFGLTGSIYYKTLFSRYDDPATLFNKDRKDQQNFIGASLEKKIWHSLKSNQSVLFHLNYQHTRSYSNIDLYEYNMNLLQLSLIYNF